MRLTTEPTATEFPGMIVNPVEVGEGVAATACAALSNPTANTRPERTDDERRLFKGGPLEEAFTITQKRAIRKEFSGKYTPGRTPPN